MNKIVLTGRLTKDIELRYTSSQIPVTQFNLAVTRNFKNQEGVYESDFINCVAYRKLAELMKNYLKKGDKVAVDGRLQTRSYKNNEDKTVYVTEVMVENIEFLESKKNEPAVEVKEPEPNDPFAEYGETVTIDDNFLD